MQDFWNGFEKRAVSSSWIRNKGISGLISRGKFAPQTEAALKSELVGKKLPGDSAHWRNVLGEKPVYEKVRGTRFSRETPSRSEALKHVHDTNVGTKHNPSEAARIVMALYDQAAKR